MVLPTHHETVRLVRMKCKSANKNSKPETKDFLCRHNLIVDCLQTTKEASNNFNILLLGFNQKI